MSNDGGNIEDQLRCGALLNDLAVEFHLDSQVVGVSDLSFADHAGSDRCEGIKGFPQ